MSGVSLFDELHINQPSLAKLSFSDSTPAALMAWIQTLPRANISLVANSLYDCLIELNQVIVKPQIRLELLEILRKETFGICSHLDENFLKHSVVLDERSRKIFETYYALHKTLSDGYKLVLAEKHLLHHEKALVAVAVHRVMSSLYACQALTLKHHNKLPEHFWKELHQLYLFARQDNVQQVNILDPVSLCRTNSSAEHIYKAIMLLGCLNTNQFQHHLIAQIVDILEFLANYAELKRATDPQVEFVYSPMQDQSPKSKKLFNEEQLSRLLGMDIKPVFHILNGHLQTKKPIQFQDDTTEINNLEAIRCMVLSWDIDNADRKSNRIPIDLDISVCVSMTNIHRLMIGNDDFERLFKIAPTVSFNHEVDLWSSGKKFEHSGNWMMEAGEGLNSFSNDIAFTFTSPSTNPNLADALMQRGSLVNQSPGGYCIQMAVDAKKSMQSGEMIALNDHSSHLQIAAIRWLDFTDDQVMMGVQVITDNAKPCAIKLITKTNSDIPYVRAFLTHEGEGINTIYYVITPSKPFEEGYKIHINDSESSIRVLLTKKRSSTESFSVFEYRTLD